MSFIAVICSYLLFAPFYLEINSLEGLYGIRFHHLAKGRLVLNEEGLRVNLRIAGWEKAIDVLSKDVRKKVTKSSPGKQRQVSKPSLSLFKDLFFSFKVNKFYMNVDTGNEVLNGLAYPLFYWAGKYADKPIRINFTGRNEFVLEIENNLANILKTFIYSKIKNKKPWKI